MALYGGPGYAQADDWAALFASGVIVFNAVQLLKPPLAELMDAAPSALVERVRTVAATVPGVAGIEKVHARKSGGRYWVDMHLEVDPMMSVRRAHELAHEVKDTIRAALGRADPRRTTSAARGMTTPAAKHAERALRIVGRA